MTVGTEQREILDAIVAPFAIYVFDLDGDSVGFGMPFVPPATATTLSETLAEITPDQAVATDAEVIAIFQMLYAFTEKNVLMALQGAIRLSCE